MGDAFQDASALLLGVGLASFWTDGPANLWLVSLTFAGVIVAARLLFDRLAGPVDHADVPSWLRKVLLVVIGAGLGIGQFWLAPVEGIRAAVLMLFAVLLAWVLAGWRQRWGERRVYRATLREPEAQPDTFEV